MPEIIISTDLPEHVQGAISEAEALALVIVPQFVSMRQARLALLQSGILQTVDNAIQIGTDEALKIEWEYAAEVRRDWQSLNDLAGSLGMTPQQLDDLFVLADSL